MVNDDLWRSLLPASLFAVFFSCGCLQTPMTDGSLRTASPGLRSKPAAADDAGAASLAVAKPSRSAAADPAAARATTDGPDVNPVQTTSARLESPDSEQAPMPRQGATNQGQPPTANGQPAKDSAAAAPAPGANGAAVPPQPINRYSPQPAFAKKLPPGPPGAAGLVPPGGLAVDPHQRTVPTATGGLLNLQPGESLAERALELTARLQASDADRQALDVRARELAAALDIRDRTLAQHGRDIHEAADEVAKAREQVSAWRKELEDARVRLKSREQDDVDTLKAVITVLERLTEADARHESAPRMPEE